MTEQNDGAICRTAICGADFETSSVPKLYHQGPVVRSPFSVNGG